jgi:hypothetical protein
MPTAICNGCNELIHWVNTSRKYIKDQGCKCGSKSLIYVSGTLEDNSWVYRDRKGVLKKIVPRDTTVTFK